MKNNLFTDAKTAAGIFADLRRARKEGKAIEPEKAAAVPVYAPVSFFSTVEGCALSRCSEEVTDAVRDAFAGLTYEEKCRLAFAPEDGEYVGRARCWRALLGPAVEARIRSAAMVEILRLYIRLKGRG